MPAWRMARSCPPTKLGRMEWLTWVPIDQIPGVVMPGGSPPTSPSTTPAVGAACPKCQAPVEASQVICVQCGTNLSTGQAVVFQSNEADTKFGAIRKRGLEVANASLAHLRRIIDKVENHEHRVIIWRSLGAACVVILAVGLFIIFKGEDNPKEMAQVEKASGINDLNAIQQEQKPPAKETGKLLYTLDTDPSDFSRQNRWGKESKILSIAWHPNSTNLVVGLTATTNPWKGTGIGNPMPLGEIQIWDAFGKPSGRNTLFFPAELKGRGTSREGIKIGSIAMERGGSASSVTWSPNGTKLAGIADREATVWDAANPQKPASLKTLRSPSSRIYLGCIAWSPDGKQIACGGYEVRGDIRKAKGVVEIWNPTLRKKIKQFKGSTGIVTSVAWSPNGKKLAAGDDINFVGGGKKRTVKIWDVQTGTNVFTFKEHVDSEKDLGGLNITWSPDGEKIASGMPRHFASLKVWKVSSGEILYTLKGTSATWSPDGKRIATISENGHVKVWDALTGKELFEFLSRRERMDLDLTDYTFFKFLSWSPDGKKLAIAGKSNILIWAMPEG